LNGSYELKVRQRCPSTEIVFDLFHVVAKCGREVIDRVRVDEANRLRQDIGGMNNRIKVIKRMAYGYRDDEYLFLKIRAAFPELAR